MHEPKAFIPPQPERLPPRTPRMPRVDELPVPAQNEIRARRGQLAPQEHPEKRRMSLLQRLAQVGLGRREQDEEESRANPAEKAMGVLRMPHDRAAPGASPAAAGIAPRSDLGIRQAPDAAGTGPPRPPGACA